jgi:uncharacterized protein YprB with RNaseH-like and TPR domain
MRLEDQLRNLDRLQKSSQRNTANPGLDHQLIEMLEGTLSRNKFGEFVLVKKSFDAKGLYQESRMQFPCSVNGEMLVKICSPRKLINQQDFPDTFDLKDAVFFDCETTGLAGGAGTYAFLVGVGYFLGKEFVVEQYFMQDFHQERAILTAVAERLNSFKFLVSYNGKCFDLPLLETRWVIHRIDFDHEKWFHVDLLFPCRRLWKRRIGDCSLGNIEAEILDLKREVDVPSCLIPQIYFDYLRTGELEPLVPVFHHNLYDILSLLNLSVTIDHLLEGKNINSIRDPLDLFSIGKIHRNLGNYQVCVKYLKQVLDENLQPEFESEVSLYLSFLYKKMGLFEDATQIWQNAAERSVLFPLRAHEELAKYYEHKQKKYHQALLLVDNAISHLNCNSSFSNEAARLRRLTSFEYRRSRLEKKIKKATERGG